MTPQESTLQSRISSPAHRETVKHLFGLSAKLANERAKLAADRNLSDDGRRSQESAFAKKLVRDLAGLSRPVRQGKASAAAARASFKLPEIDRRDVVSEMQRAELRAHIRSLPLEDRVKISACLDDTQLLAILTAPSLLSGLPEDRFQHIKSAFLERQFGMQSKEIESREEDLVAVESAAAMVRRDLQIGAGLGNNDFSALEKSYEQ